MVTQTIRVKDKHWNWLIATLSADTTGQKIEENSRAIVLTTPPPYKCSNQKKELNFFFNLFLQIHCMEDVHIAVSIFSRNDEWSQEYLQKRVFFKEIENLICSPFLLPLLLALDMVHTVTNPLNFAPQINTAIHIRSPESVWHPSPLAITFLWC